MNQAEGGGPVKLRGRVHSHHNCCNPSSLAVQAARVGRKVEVVEVRVDSKNMLSSL